MMAENHDIYRIRVPNLTLFSEPSKDSRATSECLYGEQIEKIEDNGDWFLVRCLHDNYRGFMHCDALEPLDPGREPGHRVITRSTLLFTDADIKSPIRFRIPFLSQVRLADESDGQGLDNDHKQQSFARTSDGFFIWRDHLMPLNVPVETDVTGLVRSHFLGAPYVWGGRSPGGLDCSGLVQALATSKGLTLPRDSHEQETSIGEPIEISQLKAGDLVFWPGHVGILSSTTQLMHSTAYSLSCVEEPLENVIKRAGPVRSAQRLFS